MLNRLNRSKTSYIIVPLLALVALMIACTNSPITTGEKGTSTTAVSSAPASPSVPTQVLEPIVLQCPSSQRVELSVLVEPLDAGNVEIAGSEILTNGGATPVCKNDQINIIARPNDGWRLDHWEMDVTGTRSTAVIVMTGSKKIRAIFVPVSENRTESQAFYKLTVNGEPVKNAVIGLDNGSIEVSPAPGAGELPYRQGTIVVLTARAFEGFVFVGWIKDCSGTLPCVLLMDGNRSVEAVIRPEIQTSPVPGDPTPSATPKAPQPAALAAPILDSPVNLATGVSTVPTIRWNPVTDAHGYRLAISTTRSGFPSNSGGTGCVEPECFLDINISKVEYTLPIELDNSTTFFWRVQAIGSGATPLLDSPYSGLSSFTTEGAHLARCSSLGPLSNSALASLTLRHFPEGLVPQTGDDIRVTAYAVARAESSGNPTACGDDDQSIGLWQIHTPAHPQYNLDCLFNSDCNAQAAVQVSSNGLNWNPWCTWEKSACGELGDKRYLAFVDEARSALGITPKPLPEPPVLNLSVQSVDFAMTDSARSLGVSNTGGGTLNWAVAADRPWLSVNPSGGATTAETNTVTVTVDRADLISGAYDGSLIFTAGRSTQIVTVTMQVPELPPVLNVANSLLDFGKADSVRSLSVRNTGGGTVNWTVAADQAWLSVNPSNGSTTTETDTVVVTIARDGLPSGNYDGSLTFSAGEDSEIISILATVPELEPSLRVSTSSIDFGTTMSVRSFSVINAGEGARSWSVAASQPWLSASPSSGVTATETEITVTIDRGTMAVGNYSGELVFTSDGGEKTVTAGFTQLGYELTTIANPSNGGSITGAGIYLSGSKATVAAFPNSGWILKGWRGGCSGTEPCMVTMNSAQTVTADFIAYPIAGFSMGSGGQSVKQDQILNLTVAPEGTASVSFSTTSFDLDGSIIGYRWTINGNLVSTSSNHTFGLSVGTHQVSLTVTDNSNFNNSVGATIVVTESTPQATIVSFGPPGMVHVVEGESVDLSVRFLNDGTIPWRFTAGATVWNSGGQQVANYTKTMSFALEPGQVHIANWAHPAGSIGEYWIQYGVWIDTPFIPANLLDKKPSPSQKLIVVQKFSQNSRVQTTANLNVRTNPGTEFAEITGNGYPGFAPAGATGTVVDGPIASDGFVWWKVEFDSGYTGWSAENWLESI